MSPFHFDNVTVTFNFTTVQVNISPRKPVLYFPHPYFLFVMKFYITHYPRG